MKEPILIFQKNAEETTNKIRLPKLFIEKFGKSFYMKVYDDKIEIVPINKKGE